MAFMSSEIDYSCLGDSNDGPVEEIEKSFPRLAENRGKKRGQIVQLACVLADRDSKSCERHATSAAGAHSAQVVDYGRAASAAGSMRVAYVIEPGWLSAGGAGQ